MVLVHLFVYYYVYNIAVIFLQDTKKITVDGKFVHQ